MNLNFNMSILIYENIKDLKFQKARKIMNKNTCIKQYTRI